MSPHVNYEIQLIMMYQHWLINCNKGTTQIARCYHQALNTLASTLQIHNWFKSILFPWKHKFLLVSFSKGRSLLSKKKEKEILLALKGLMQWAWKNCACPLCEDPDPWGMLWEISGWILTVGLFLVPCSSWGPISHSEEVQYFLQVVSKSFSVT